MSLFDEVFKVVVGHEGGLSLNRNDRGNWTSGIVGQGELKGTKFGIASHVYPHLDIRNLTVEQAREIYRANYWNPVGGEFIGAKYGGGLALAVMDTAINSGVGRALKFYQNWKSVDSYLNGRMTFLRGLDSWDTFGRGWTKRVDQIEEQAVQFDLRFPAQPVELPTPIKPINVDQAIQRLSGVRRVYVNGELQDGKVDAVSMVGDKLYVRLEKE